MDGPAPRAMVLPWRALPARALEAVARAGCVARRPAGPARDEDPVQDEVRPDLDDLEHGVTMLAAALGLPGLGGDGSDTGRDRVRAALRRAAELTAVLGDAARQASWAATGAGQDPAADVADAVMTAALSLRILAEIGLRAVPPVDATSTRGR